MTIVVTSRRLSRSDILLLVFLGWLAFRSYEAMAYLGPLLAAAIAWRLRTTAAPGPAAPRNLLGYFAALLFVGAPAVSCVTIAQYSHHPYFIPVLLPAFH